MKKELWAVRGKYLDNHSDETINNNLYHYEVWRYSQCYENGHQNFNIEFLGKWRNAETMPDMEYYNKIKGY